MRGTQEVKYITVTDKGDIQVDLWHGYDIILSAEETQKLIIQLNEALEQSKKQFWQYGEKETRLSQTPVP